MKITSLQIEEFGTRSHLKLDGLSDQLNVIYGPNGSGKSTIIDFIRWMLFGGVDEVPRRYLSSAGLRLGGSIRLVDGHQRRQVLHRTYDSVQGDRLRVTDDAMRSLETIDPRHLTGVNLDEYGHVFCFGFDQPPILERLIDVATAHDVVLSCDPYQTQQVRDLTARLDQLRNGDRTERRDDVLPMLHDRRQQLQADLLLAERHCHERLEQVQRDRDDLLGEITTDRQRLDSYQAMLHRTEATIDTRRAQLCDSSYHASQTRQNGTVPRQQEIEDIDYQIQQWHNVLDAIRQRHECLQLAGPVAQVQPALSGPTDETELRLFLGSLGYQIDDIEQDLRDWESSEHPARDRNHTDYLRSVLGTALQTMRDDVQRLCGEVQRHRTDAQRQERAREQDHLRRCEAELTSLIDSLTQRRRALTAVVGHSDEAWLDHQRVTPPTNGTISTRPSRVNGSKNDNGVHRGPTHSPPMDPVLEARLAHLRHRRDHLATRVRELADRIEYNEHRRSQLQENHQHLDEARNMDQLRRDLDDAEQRIRLAGQREGQRAEIEALEEQIDKLRPNRGPSDILREAGSLLLRLSGGTYHGLRIDDGRGVSVEDDRGHILAYSELSRAARDQVYLSLALAVVAAYRRRGIELPVILNDVFVNIDLDRADATAEVLAQFAKQGHQVILFTRHEHVMRRFTSLNAQQYTLRQRDPAGDLHRSPALPARETPPRAEPYFLDQAPDRTDRPWPAPDATRDTTHRARSYDWVSQWDPPSRSTPVPSEQDSSGERARHLLMERSPVAEVEWLDRQTVRHLHDVGIDTVLQFIETDPEDARRHLAPFKVSAATVYRWQSEIALQCYVGLTANDAALLVACGVNDPEELSYADVSRLHRRIEAFLEKPEARERYGSIARFERSRLSRWIQAAGRSHFRRRARVQRRPVSQPPQGQPITYRPERTERVGPRPRRIDPARSSRVVEAAETSQPRDTGESEALRFFLEPSDPIVDAPSIGPKTAERFHAIGVTTVAELLEQDPVDTAGRIDYRRISPDLIRSWQLQTSLVCRVPNLRGHDAQLLVACDIPGPEQLAKMEPEPLLAQVTQLLGTAQGKRILRSAKAPDLEEITAWIRWAQNARELQLT